MIHSTRRIILKISGSLLRGKKNQGFCWEFLYGIGKQIAALSQYQFVLIVGGGNFFRGRDALGKCPSHAADTIGTLATVMNGVALSSVFHQLSIPNQLFCARAMEGIGRPYAVPLVQEALNQNQVVICAGGLGHGAMTTDTTAVVRACELEGDLVLKATSVQGAYDKDPLIHTDALFYPFLTYQAVLDQRLGIMDLAAISLAMEHRKSLVIFSCLTPDKLACLFQGTLPYTLIAGES